jgi:hypothetical protein
VTMIEDVTVNGDDTQNVIGSTVAGDVIRQQIKIVRARPAMFLSEEEASMRAAVHVKVLNHETIVSTLTRENSVALCGPRGSGRLTTAIVALREARPGLTLRWFSCDHDDLEEVSLDAEPRGYLLRARDENRSQLRSFLETVRRARGLAIIIGTPDEVRDVADYLTKIEIEPPFAEHVFTRHLGVFPLAEPDRERALDLLKGATPASAAWLAQLVIEHYPCGGMDEVEQTHGKWKVQLRHWFEDHDALLDKTLLIAAAAVAPADETQVYGAAYSLARKLDIKPEGGGLAWTRTTRLDAVLEAQRHGGIIDFGKRDYDRAVLHYVCAEHPLARTELLDWLSELPDHKALAFECALGDRLAETFSEVAAEYGRHEKITQTAREWAVRDRPELAFIALAHTCLHPQVGSPVRSKLYEWATSGQTPQTLKLTIAGVCQVLGQTHLSIALTRLQHLAARGNPQVRAEVVRICLELAELNTPTVLMTALSWARKGVGKSYPEAYRRLDVASALARELLPRCGPRELDEAFNVLRHLVVNGDTRLREPLLTWGRKLSHISPERVLKFAFDETTTPDDGLPGSRGRLLFGTELFLSLVASRDEQTSVSRMATRPAFPVEACPSPWRIALTFPERIPQLNDALSCWLDTAVACDDLRPRLAEALVFAAGRDSVRRQRLVLLVRAWAENDPRGRRPVKEAVLVGVLMPFWRRWLLSGWVTARDALLPML